MSGKKNKIFLMASKEDCPFCAAMEPIFHKTVQQFSGLEGLSFGIYKVEDDDWDLADKLGLDGVPGFAMVSSDGDFCYEVNNDGMVSPEILSAMIVNNINKT